jgi:hypothetical protein
MGSLLLLQGVQEPGAQTATEMFRLLRAERSRFLVRFRQPRPAPPLFAKSDAVSPIAAAAMEVNDLDNAA